MCAISKGCRPEVRGYESYSPRALNGHLHGLHEFGMTERLTYK